MTGSVADRKRLIRVTEGNLRNNHINIATHYDFFPVDCIGGPRVSAGNGKPIRIQLAGLGRTIETDIGRDAKTGKPRRQLRTRTWVKRFFAFHSIRAGDVLSLERVGDREYALNVERPSVWSERSAKRVAEFFAGIGLVRLALERHGLKVVFANDIDRDKFAMYQDNFPEEDFCLGDIHSLSEEDIPDCDLATASFPCNDLSIAGAMKGINSGQSSAFWGLVRLLGEMGNRRPAFVLLENVPGFLMSQQGNDFRSALVALNKLGYACDAFCLDASYFVPQSRQRLFVLGMLGASAESAFGLEASLLRPKALVDFVHSHAEICWNVGPLPCPPKRRKTLRTILENLPDDHPAWWNKARADYFMHQLSERHLAIAKEMISRPCYSYGTAFRRIRKGRSMAELRVDGLAGCLRTPRGGSGRQILFKAGKGRYFVRLLTPRECARLQGVPDTYRIGVPLNKALFGFGDAVCVPVIEWIAEHYLLPCMGGSSAVWIGALGTGAGVR